MLLVFLRIQIRRHSIKLDAALDQLSFLKDTFKMGVLCLIFLLFTMIRHACSSEQRHMLGAIKTVSHHKLDGHQIKILKGSTLLSCAHSCLAEPKCVSTNFGVSPAENKLVCELNDHRISLLSNEELEYAEGFVFSLYSETFQTGSDIKDGCKQITCLNQGHCYFHEDKQKFQCKCILPWTGNTCEAKTDTYYNFTALGATGRFGPNNNLQYQGTSLEGILVQDGLQTWNVPVTAQYHLELCGASGAESNFFKTKGGRGAKVQGSVHLQQGTELTVLVGQQGKGGGGGGGTFVVFAVDGNPLAVAGGGGSADIVDGDHGQAGYSGSVNPGQPGKGGKVCVSRASFDILVGIGGGGGLFTDGRCYVDSSCNKPCIENDGGKSFNAGGQGGYSTKKRSRCAGGFGGGGNCGGGGGYSGGGVQVDGKSLAFHAGGGGSFVPNADSTVVTGGCSPGDGFVSFQIVSLD